MIVFLGVGAWLALAGVGNAAPVVEFVPPPALSTRLGSLNPAPRPPPAAAFCLVRRAVSALL